MAENKLIRNISMMSVAILISRVLGLVRDQLMAFFLAPPSSTTPSLWATRFPTCCATSSARGFRLVRAIYNEIDKGTAGSR